MNIREIWHGFRQLPNPRSYATDPHRFIATARRYCLFIFAIGILAPLLALYVTDRRETYRTFSFVEKVLKVVDAVTSQTTTSPKLPLTFENAIGSSSSMEFQFIRSVTGVDDVTEIEFETPNETLATLVDPNNTCSIQTFRLTSSHSSGTKDVPLHVISPAQVQALHQMAVKPEAIFLVLFPHSCFSNIPAAEPFSIIVYGTNMYGVALSQSMFDTLGITWLIDRDYANWQENWIVKEILKKFLSEDQINRIIGFEKPFLNVVDVQLLRTKVLDKASTVSGRQYSHAELDDSFRAIYGYVNEPDERLVNWWIFTETQRVVVSITPIALLIFSFLLVYTLRRINPNATLENEPWLIIRPQGWFETLGAFSWISLHFAAFVSISWSVWEFNYGSWGAVRGYWYIMVELFPNELFTYSKLTVVEVLKSLVFWLLFTTFLSSILLVFATGYMCRLISCGIEQPGADPNPPAELESQDAIDEADEEQPE